MNLTATNYPQASPLGIQTISVVRHDPGLDLTMIGMPGCFLFTGLEETHVVLPVAGRSSYWLPIPNSLTLQGARVNSQTLVLSIGSNPFGFITSNGVAMTIGQ